MQYDSKSPLTVILGMMAKDYGINPDMITIVVNRLLKCREVSRYEWKGENKYKITLGKEFAEMMDNGDISGIQEELKACLSILGRAHTTKLDAPAITVKDSDFDWEYVIRARHASGITITKVSAFPHFMEMKQEIHEETATILESLAKGK